MSLHAMPFNRFCSQIWSERKINARLLRELVECPCFNSSDVDDEGRPCLVVCELKFRQSPLANILQYSALD